MIIRVKTRQGQTLRVTLESNSRLNETLLKQILDQVIPKPRNSDPANWQLYRDAQHSEPKGGMGFHPDATINSKTASSYGLKHGDIVYLKPVCEDAPDDDALEGGVGSAEELERDAAGLKQDPVDDYLDTLDGLIARPKDAKFCTHGPKGMCDYCMPLEPYDSKYLAENKIKHLSFHSFIRSLTSKNKSVIGSSKPIPFLEEPNFTVNLQCPGHKPYPQGICSKCQPSAITLKPQSFRMVDHVEFDSAGIVDNFLAGWRTCGYQRFGYLYGYYRPYLDVPLGIKAVVVAIYEPLQDNSVDGLELISPDPLEETVENMAKALGLCRVGMIYTDLVDDGSGTGKVLCKRHPDSYFVSSLEVLFIARQQLAHRNVCKYSSSNYFGSKFVTLVVSGDEEGNVAISEYQVSNIGMGLVRDEIVEGSTDASLMRVQESDGSKYVPDLFYMFTNEYNVNVKTAAAPTFPVDYLLLTLTHGFRSGVVSESLFAPEGLGNPYPRMNRATVGMSDPSMIDLKRKLDPVLAANSASSDLARQCFQDFHTLVHLFRLELLSRDDSQVLCQAVRDGKENPALWVKFLACSSWLSVKKVLLEANLSASSSKTKTFAPWPCPHCTFSNENDPVNCEMCGLPKN